MIAGSLVAYAYVWLEHKTQC